MMTATKQASAARGIEGLRARVTLRRGAFHLQSEFNAPAGLTALLGPSGAGKSLTLQAITGLTALDQGIITLHGRTLADTSAGIALPPRLRRVGYVPQSYALFPHLTVAGNIAYGLPRDLDPAARRKRVAALLELARLPGYEDRRPRDLSGGEAQRVAIARALAADPQALLLDEPFSALDAPTRVALRGDLRALIAAAGLPTILVTHDLAEARALASRLALLHAGHLIAEGPIEQVIAEPPTLLAARLLGWSAALAITRCGDRAGAIHITLTCGQRLTLTETDCAPDALAASSSAGLALAIRPERLQITHADAVPATPAASTLRGVIDDVRDTGALLTLRITLAGADSTEPPLEAPVSPREWESLGLAPGDEVILSPLSGAFRLVTTSASSPAPSSIQEEATL